MIKRNTPGLCLSHFAAVIAFSLVGLSSALAQTVPYSVGRIAVSSDGNMHDDDDWGASAATLAIIASQGLQEKLSVYVYNDHVWGSENNDEAEMELSVVQTAAKFGFLWTGLYSAVDDPDAAYNAMRDAILASTASDPLTIIAGGPMQVTGRALELAKASDPSVLQHIRVISHSNWNNAHSDKPITDSNKADYEPSHSGWTWSEMESAFAGNGVIFDQIADQNNYESQTVGFATTKASSTGGKYWDAWYFMRDYSAHSVAINGAIQYCYSRLQAVNRPDLSDSGMAYYLFTGDDQGGPVGLEAMFDNGFSVPLPVPVIYGAVSDFSALSSGAVPFYKDTARGALAIDASNVSNRDQFARAKVTFNGGVGHYIPRLTTMKETDGESRYRLWVNGVLIETVTNDVTVTDYELQVHEFPAIVLAGDESIWVEAMAVSNEQVPEGTGFAYSRGRWTELQLVPFASGVFTVSAGDDRTIQLPANRLTLEGSANGDYDSIQWSQVSGPNIAVLGGADTVALEVSGLIRGAYVFELEVSNASTGASQSDLVSVILTDASNTWHESAGILVMEAENTVSNYGLWELKTTYQTHSGSGYLEFTGNSPVSGTAKSPLEYAFTIHQSGLYYLHLHCAKKAQEVDGAWRGDVANDCYVKVTGDYDQSPDAGDSHNDDAKYSLLSKNTKFFGGDQKKFGWFPNASLGGQLDPGGENNKRVAVYDFKEGETYTLVLSGRSRDFAVDRILFRHVDTAYASATVAPESSKDRVTLVIDAGDDQTVALPLNTATLSAEISSLSAVTSIQWGQTSGPAVTMQGADSADLQLSHLVAGTYLFTLSVEASDGSQEEDTVMVTVIPEPRGEVYYVDFATNISSSGGDQGLGVPTAPYPTYNLIARDDIGEDGVHSTALLTVDGVNSGVDLDIALTRAGVAFRPKGLLVEHLAGSGLGIDEKAYGDGLTINNGDMSADILWEFAFSGLTEATYNVTLLAGTSAGDVTNHWSLISGTGGNSGTTIGVAGGEYSTVVRWVNVSPEAGVIAFQGLSLNPYPGVSKWNLTSHVMFLSLEIVPDGGFTRFEVEHQLVGGASGDDDGDGVSNLREYAMGGDPKDAGYIGFPTEVKFDLSGAPYLSTAERIDSDHGIIYTVQMRTDLTSGDWIELPNYGRSRQPIEGVVELEAVKHMLPTGMDLAERIFLRVVVEEDSI